MELFMVQMFSSGPNFMGIKMIPPGVHFVYYSSSNRLASFLRQCYSLLGLFSLWLI